MAEGVSQRERISIISSDGSSTSSLPLTHASEGGATGDEGGEGGLERGSAAAKRSSAWYNASASAGSASACPCLLSRSSGVSPSAVVARGSAPCSSSNRTSCA
eukprot:scaffold100419_cov32-Tisochrysis_lutea.AAC.2